MRQVLLGMSSAGTLVAALFFLRFFRQTHDALFAWFAAAFALLAAQAFALGLATPDAEITTYLYLPRLLAFVLIIVAIVQKNRGSA